MKSLTAKLKNFFKRFTVHNDENTTVDRILFVIFNFVKRSLAATFSIS